MEAEGGQKGTPSVLPLASPANAADEPVAANPVL